MRPEAISECPAAQAGAIQIGGQLAGGVSLKDWGWIENDQDVAATLRQMRSVPRQPIYDCAEEYDLAYPGYDGDAVYYVDRSKQGRVLYLGVGTGRIFREIAAANPEAIGLDNSPPMLRRFFVQNPGINPERALLADAAGAELPENHFDAIVAPFSFLQLFDGDRALLVLRNVQRWLKPAGTFHTDLFSPYLIAFRKKGLEVNARAIPPDTRVSIYIQYDHVRQSMTELAYFDSPRGKWVMEMNLHYYFPRQLHACFREAGLPEPVFTGDYRSEPFDPTNHEILVLTATKPPPLGLASPNILPVVE